MFSGISPFSVVTFRPNVSLDLPMLSKGAGRVRADAGRGRGVRRLRPRGVPRAGCAEVRAGDADGRGLGGGRVPVFTGTGGPLSLARQHARVAGQAGPDSQPLMPLHPVASPAADAGQTVTVGTCLDPSYETASPR